MSRLPDIPDPSTYHNPNMHEAGHFYPPCNFGIGFCQLNLFKNFKTFLEVKIDINHVDMS